ncbi:MAG: globin [Dehalococcoidia bacterium]|jgi:hemoglobin|nr:globin [Dehalococcoidia bacterium]
MTEQPDFQPAAPLIPPRLRAQRQAELLDRIGGREVIERVVDAFYDAVETDEELRPLFPEDMDDGREKQKLFLEQWLGGEPRYSEQYGHPRLRRRHFPFVISERAAGRWMRHMIQAFRDCGVGEPEVGELVASFGPMAKHMVNAGEELPREPLGDVRLT